MNDLHGMGDLCSCGRSWGSVMPPPPCPVHSQPLPVPTAVPVPNYYPTTTVVAPALTAAQPDRWSELRQAVADLYLEHGDLDGAIAATRKIIDAEAGR